MAHHREDLLDNFQPVGNSGYYVDVIRECKEGAENARPIGDTSIWVRFNATVRDLDGNIVLTRNADHAKLLNTFTKYTRYVPFYRYCGAENAGLTEGVWLAMHNPLSLDNGTRTARLRIGAVADLYLPSILVGSVSASGGYEGETSLSGDRPVILHMEIVDTVANPLSREGQEVDDFCTLNGGLLRYVKEGSSEISSGAVTMPEKAGDANHPYLSTTQRWVSACDSVAQLYVNYRYKPEENQTWQYPEMYRNRYAPYDNPEQLNRDIDAALIKRFHTDTETPYVGVENLQADSVGLDGTAKIWYIGRFLDGFIFDTNIDEVKELIYDAGYETGSALSYTPSDGGLIQAFYYTVPKMQYGQWAALITTSTNAYGSSGQTGSSTTTTSGGNTSSYYDYLNYMNYMNSYYNNYYGGYYNNYYGGYY
ncbi:MAG: hypothetical protein K2H42_02115, partial [Alistipes sp.]|nr:hypothetical protein [Alistipes sp.]